MLGWLLAWGSTAGFLHAALAAPESMRAAAALGLLLSAASLLASQSRPGLAVGLSQVVLVLGVLGLAARLWPDPGAGSAWLEAILPASGTRPDGRMTVLAAPALILLGGIGWLVTRRKLLWLRETAAVSVLLVSLASGASWGLVLAGDPASMLHELPLCTAVLLFVLTLAWMAVVPSTGLARIAIADSLGGAFARRLILPTLLIPVWLAFGFQSAQSWLGMSWSTATILASVTAGGALAGLVIWVAFLLDRGERQQRVVRALRQDVHTDGLTGLANRRALDEALDRLLADRHGKSLCVLMLDLDRFKRFNDRFGHLAGDEVLRETGRLLRGAVREGDLVTRYGGEEFAILLPRAGPDDGVEVGERILTAFRQHPWSLAPVTISIGAAFAGPGEGAQSLLRRADEALYQSKQAGRDRLTLADGPPRAH